MTVMAVLVLRSYPTFHSNLFCASSMLYKNIPLPLMEKVNNFSTIYLSKKSVGHWGILGGGCFIMKRISTCCLDFKKKKKKVITPPWQIGLHIVICYHLSQARMLEWTFVQCMQSEHKENSWMKGTGDVDIIQQHRLFGTRKGNHFIFDIFKLLQFWHGVGTHSKIKVINLTELFVAHVGCTWGHVHGNRMM